MRYFKEILIRVLISLAMILGSLALGVLIGNIVILAGFEPIGEPLKPVLFLLILFYVQSKIKLKRMRY